MNKSTVLLNYLAFFILYITSFIFIYTKNTEIIGYYVLFIANTACTIYNISYFSMVDALNLIPRSILISVIVSGILHTIAFVFIIMMINSMKVKYENTFGTPINLPPIYKSKLDIFKGLILTTFFICFILLVVFMYYFDSINFIFNDQIKTFGDILRNKFSVGLLILSLASIIISAIQVNTANSFSILTRQNLMK